MSEPAISIITPTYRRDALLRQQHQTVLSQEEQNFEWLILDDSPEPSSYFQRLTDPRIHYRHHAGPRLSIGAKRNQLVEAATSEIIAHFDDDDYYAPCYLRTLLGRLAERGADITKLSGWFVYSTIAAKLGYWDTAQTRGLHYRFSPEPQVLPVMFGEEQSRMSQSNYAGFGFSYVYRKPIWRQAPFPDIDGNEDLGFVIKALENGGRIEHFRDTEGLCLHILRRDNMSICFPQFLLPDFLLDRIFPPAVKALLT
jgi:glycosyltransferase involved in cell wall biosynthesis